ncbi:FAD-binding monooxygenase [Actinosynnema pretiosum]|uniref:FAD-binding monooxygenase n=1 Tax=Actinosynnema pretiosum TaxID=42197 RepID=A0A290ZH47_9PSEU|nr:FAD-binding monooxygenase [Actinosynnema pretiosum]
MVVGGSIAGCATAIRFSRMGHRVALLDRKTMDDGHHKRLCTHFIQPHAVPLLAGLGLEHLYGPEWSVRTKAVFVTPGGVVEGPGLSYDPDQPGAHALNLERRVLDPALRESARRHGVEYLDGTGVESIGRDGPHWVLETNADTDGGRDPRRFRARLVVAADGRRSRLAKELGNPAESRPNERAALFGYFTGITTRADQRSVFVMHERDLACTYPLPGGRTQLVLFADKARVEGWGGADSRMREFLAYFDGLPDAPSTAGAVPEGGLLGYTDYPSLLREPVVDSVPFVGDAALSLDPMSGVGCGFALASADLLANSFADRSLDGADREAGLAEYRERYSRVLLPHAEGICVDSLVGKDETSRRRMFETISADPELSRRYLALTGRMTLPAEFQRLFMRALMTRRRPAVKR